MAYGTVKVDNITFDNGGSDQNVTVSGLYNSLTSGITVTGTISGTVVIGSTSVSGTTVAGVTVTGTTVQGASGTFTSLTGTTTTGTTATYTTGSFTSLTGTTTTGTTANFVSGVFSTSVSGATVIAPTGTFTSLTGTTTQGTTATYTTGSFTSLTGTTTTGTTSSFTSGVFTTLSGATATFTSGIIASGTDAAPSLAILGDPDTGVFSPGANQLAVATNGTERLRIDSSGRLLVGTSSDVGGGDLIQSDTSIASFRASTAAGISPLLKLLRSRGSTFSLSDAVLNNDSVGRILFQAVDGSSLISAAQIEAEVDGTPGANDMPGRLVFSTNPGSPSTAPTERMRIDSTGKVAIGASPGNAIQLTVDGNIPDDGQVFAIGIKCSAIANATTSNIYGFISDIEPTVGTVNTVTGLYRYNARQLNSFGSATVTNQYGFAADSSLTGATNNYGFFSNINAATDRWNFYAAGTANNYFAGKVGIGTTSPATTLDVDGDVTISDKIIHAGDTDTAIRFPEANNFTVETNGTERMRITSDGKLVMGGITPATGTNYSICTPGRLQSDGTYSVTTASSANVVVISSGLFLRSTSSIKYKTEVEDAELSYSEALVYGSRPVWYRSLSESDPSDYSYWGFIAEEVAEIDPRMVHWGDDGPEGVQYDRYVVHLVSVIQKQQQRLDVLEARIAALEA